MPLLISTLIITSLKMFYLLHLDTVHQGGLPSITNMVQNRSTTVTFDIVWNENKHSKHIFNISYFTNQDNSTVNDVRYQLQ